MLGRRSRFEAVHLACSLAIPIWCTHAFVLMLSRRRSWGWHDHISDSARAVLSVCCCFQATVESPCSIDKSHGLTYLEIIWCVHSLSAAAAAVSPLVGGSTAAPCCHRSCNSKRRQRPAAPQHSRREQGPRVVVAANVNFAQQPTRSADMPSLTDHQQAHVTSRSIPPKALLHNLMT